MTDHDIKVGKELLEEDFVKQNEGWVKELETMLRTKQKAEIQALCPPSVPSGFSTSRRSTCLSSCRSRIGFENSPMLGT